jgi:uncharacterized protein
VAGTDPVADLDVLGDAKYLLLTTFRRDGTPVATPVWFARTAQDAVVVVTQADSGKVKRLRNDPRCTVAPCDVRGRTEVPAVAATGRTLDGQAAADADRALARRYGLAWHLFGLAARLRRRDPASSRTHLVLTAAG